MTGYETEVWRVTEWCERRQIPANVRLLFADWYSRAVTAQGLCLPLGAAYLHWQASGRP